MSEMIDRALRAWLKTARGQRPANNVLSFEELDPEQLEESRQNMRAAILAMHEPTEAMEDAGCGHEFYCRRLRMNTPSKHMRAQWRAMIFEALK